MMGYIFGSTDNGFAPVLTITPAANTIVIPAGTYVNSLGINPTSNEQIDLSEVSNGATDIEEKFPAAAGTSSTIIIETKYDVETTLYFGNLTGPIEVTLYILR